ncbi:LsmAD domain [Lasallia pustulata]|uniref:LsmAD domain n=1 Tax=Lasallia pustulata TaxID=136370 RepID=A0A1W5CUH8_9LECA|nr:LsmAD domain [Lasallia pustulata]
MATTALNGATLNDTNSSSAPLPASRRQQSKGTFGNKSADGNRRQADNGGDNQQRRNPPQKAWTSGMNPITQRSTTPAQPNGVGGHPKPSSQRSMPASETSTPDRHANDRFLFLLANFIGLQSTVTVKNGDTFSGILTSCALENNEPTYFFKMVRRVKLASEAESNGVVNSEVEYIGSGEDHAMSFEAKDVIDLAVKDVSFNVQDKGQNGATTAFRTDADISGNLAFRERSLQRWQPPAADADVDVSLEADTTGSGTWDQFEANSQLFGLKSDYDENIYTTRIDRQNPQYQQRLAAAEKIAQEIDAGSATNAHVREERNLTVDDDGLDEEEKYSGVRRNGAEYPPLQPSQQNKYTPPARRAPTGQPTVPGAPVDPAIISSQIARPDSKAQEPRKATSNQPEVSAGTANTESNHPPEPPKEAASIVPVTNENTVKAAVPPVTSKVPLSSVVASSSRKNDTFNGTPNVETAVLDSFRQFASNEKMKVQDHHRNRASKDKAVKLNDLMKFSKNFKLLTPVPKDLVPILAKDKSKQEEIMERAQRNAEQASLTPPKSAASTSDSKAQKLLPAARYEDNTSSSANSERQKYPRGPQGFPPTGPQATQTSRQRNGPSNPSGADSGPLGPRLATSHQRHRQGIQVPIPTPLPIQDPRMPPKKPADNAPLIPSPQRSGPLLSPISSAKLNVKAVEFRPANSFKPTGNPSGTSSPRSTSNTHPISRASSPSAFFGSKKPIPPGDREPIMDYFNPLKWLKKEAEEERKAKEYAYNGGIKPAYKTPPTWNPPKEGEEFKSYKDLFESGPSSTIAVSPQHSSPVNPPLAHQHQLPLHLQGGPPGIPQVHTPQNTPQQMQPQAHHYPVGPHHDDHRMYLSASSSSMYPSPRLQHNQMAYQSPMPQHAQLAYGQPMPQYIMSPTGHPPHFRQFPGPQMIASQGPHPGAQMMVQQPSGGGFMGVPQGMPIPFSPPMAMYPPGQLQAYGGPAQPPSMYGSPGRGAPMMMHQGSHQGQHPQMFMSPGQYGQPLYAQQQTTHVTPMRAGYGSPQPQYHHPSPHQQHHYPPQPHRAPSGNYGQVPHQHMAAQQPPPPPQPVELGEEGK